MSLRHSRAWLGGQRQKERKIPLKSSSKCYSQQARPHIRAREFRVTMDMC